MIEIVPVTERKPENVDTNRVFYIDNTQADSMAKKYNYAIENIEALCDLKITGEYIIEASEGLYVES